MSFLIKCKDFLDKYYKLITISALLVIFLFVLIFGSVLIAHNNEEDFVFADTEYGRSIVQVTEAGAKKSKLTVPNGVKYIGRGAFLNSLTTLVELNLPSSLEIIEDAAAPGLQNLERLNFAKSGKLKSIGVDAFNGCRRLKVVKLPAKTRNGIEIKSSAFEDCRNLEQVKNLNVAKSMGEYAFARSKLKEIKLSPQLKTISSHVFMGTNITEIEIPTSVELIEDNAFASATSLTTVTFNEGLKTLESGAFFKTDIRNLSLPSSIKSIGSEAFRYNANLKTVTFADNSNLKSVNEGAFSDCSELVSVKFPDSSTNKITLSSYLFQNCNKLENVDLGESVSILDRDAFYGNKTIKSIYLPSSIECFYGSAFFLLTEEQSIYIALPQSASGLWNRDWRLGCDSNVIWNANKTAEI